MGIKRIAGGIEGAVSLIRTPGCLLNAATSMRGGDLGSNCAKKSIFGIMGFMEVSCRH
jgi:hypothetical protein